MLEEKGKFVHKFISKTQEKETGREEEGRRDGEEERKIGRERERGETVKKIKYGTTSNTLLQHTTAKTESQYCPLTDTPSPQTSTDGSHRHAKQGSRE